MMPKKDDDNDNKLIAKKILDQMNSIFLIVIIIFQHHQCPHYSDQRHDHSDLENEYSVQNLDHHNNDEHKYDVSYVKII